MVSKKKTDATELMIVNDSPGEECRIAIIADGHLEELFSERTSTATSVGNIYKGRVTNVEPAIQAAFVDYGKGQSGFLHISDLHPQYFPGPERTERVGKKIPRRDRPPIQEALRPGSEVLVQVLKEGIGTKGPTLTSYLSVPGRLLVMMPHMDNVGVSRKVEDEDKRREMRRILDSLDLPEGFGFILRTAGFDKTKTELKRDAAYLLRLWKVMENRIKNVGAPCALYTESDLLLRTVRDIMRPSIQAIVVDSESGHQRLSAFLEVVAPRSAPKVVRYVLPSPIFHAFDIERQIELIHSREVPLHSGGQLVIEQTEALVAIDVNSGRSRSARDSETNAYETNCEAVDEICRQLRLRDLGGLVVNDLIDMRSFKHRRLIEDRFRENLKRDRARTTIAPISEFGILEMTRQRMRPSLRKAHFMPCPHCEGHGEIKTPESVGGDAVRQAGYLLQFDRIRRVELVCSGKVASVLLSNKRRALVELEDATGKRIDVRVSEAIAVDRISFYAYDERGADIDIDRLPALQWPTLENLEQAYRRHEEAEEAGDEAVDAPVEGSRRRRRRRRSGPADATTIALAGDWANIEFPEDDEEAVAAEAAEPAAEAAQSADAQGESRGGRRRRRRRRGGRDRTDQQPALAASVSEQSPAEFAAAAVAGEMIAPPEPPPVPESIDFGPALRVHELGKEIGIASKDILAWCKEQGIEGIKAANSKLEPESAYRVRCALAPETVAAPPVVDITTNRATRLEMAEEYAGDPNTADSVNFDTPEFQLPIGDDLDTEAKPEQDGEFTADADGPSQQQGDGQGGRRRRRRRRGRGGRAGETAPIPAASNGTSSPQRSSQPVAAAPPQSAADQPLADGQGGSRRRRRRRRGRGGADGAPQQAGTTPQAGTPPRAATVPASPPVAEAPPAKSTTTKKPKLLYRFRSKVNPTARQVAAKTADE